MSKTTALRLRHTHDFDLPMDDFVKKEDPDMKANGFCLEAWVQCARRDNAARLYSAKNYEGHPLRLKPGDYSQIDNKLLPQLASVDLPEGIEVVFFSEPYFKGSTLVLRDDEPEIGTEFSIGSVVILDRRHRNQSHVILFGEENYQGAAQLLLVPNSWAPPVKSADRIQVGMESASGHHIPSVRSAWVPPGIALELTTIATVAENTFEAIKECDQKLTFATFSELEKKTLSPQSWPKNIPDFNMVDIPTGTVLVFFEKENFGGSYINLTGKQEATVKLPWAPASAVFALAPGGVDGVLVFEQLPQFYPVGSTLTKPDDPKNVQDKYVYIPQGYRLKSKKSDNGLNLTAGFHRLDGQTAYQVEKLQVHILRGDLSRFPSPVISLTTRRSSPLKADSGLHYKTNASQNWQQTTDPLGDKLSPGELTAVRVPSKAALVLFEDALGEGQHELIIGGRDDLSDLSFSPKSMALLLAPDDVTDGVWDFKAHKIYAPGKEMELDSLREGAAFVPPGYRIAVKREDEINGYITTSAAVDKGDQRGTVERYVGVLDIGGNGLTIQRTSGRLKAGSDELRFGGKLLQANKWYHLAYQLRPAKEDQKSALQWVVNGKVVQEVENIHVDKIIERLYQDGGHWKLGHHLRGSIVQVRAWKSFRDLKTLRKERFSGVEVQADKHLLKNPADLADPPNAIVAEAILPDPPEHTTLLQGLQRQVKVVNEQKVLAARRRADGQKRLAEKRAQRKIELAREEARRQVHLKTMVRLSFVRGREFLVYWALENQKGKAKIELKSHEHEKGDDRQYRLATDISWGITANKSDRLYVVDSGWTKGIWGYDINAEDLKYQLQIAFRNRPQALVVDTSGKHQKAAKDGKIRTAMYWVEEDGQFYRFWDTPGTHTGYVEGHIDNDITGIEPLFQQNLPLGRPRSWDMVFYADKQQLIWCNGWEICRATVSARDNNFDLHEIDVIVPHIASPYPVAVAVAEDGTVVWLDRDREQIRYLLPGDALPKDLYAAPNPARGLSVCQIPAADSKQEVTYAYWVSGKRRTLEVPVLDTPGRYIDIWQDSKKKVPHGQHVPMVAVDERTMDWGDVKFPVQISKNRPVRFDKDNLISFGPIDLNKIVGQVQKITIQLKELKSNVSDSNPILDRDDYGGEGVGPEDNLLVKNILFQFKHQNTEDQTVRGHANWQFKTYNTYSFEYYKKDTLIINSWHPRGGIRFETGIWTELSFVFNATPSPHSRYTLEIHKDGELLGGRELSYQVEALHLVINNSKDSEVRGLIKRIQINTVKQGQEQETIYKGEDLKQLLQPNQSSEDTNSQPDSLNKHTLLFASKEDVVQFESGRIDLNKGWTAAAKVIWDGAADEPLCLYELATVEDEERLVCGITEEGRPFLHLRWKGKDLVGREVSREKNKKSERLIVPGKQYYVCWTYDPQGIFSAYIDGELVWEQRFNWIGEVRVWENHRLGAPNSAQKHQEVVNARLDKVADNPILFDGFTGYIIRFSAWNTFEPSAIKGWDNTLDYDPKWDRSLVTVESRRQYLHAGRLDGKEPPVTLFPLDMDGGLSIISNIDHSHSELNHAQVQLTAAKAHAAQLKESALKAAQAKIAEAEKHLAETKAKTDQELTEARRKTGEQKAKARQNKTNAINNARQKRARGKQQADNEKARGKREAENKEIRAADEKRNAITNASRDLRKKQDERDNKKDEVRKNS